MKININRPSDINNRLEKEIEVYNMLNKLNIDFERMDHEEVSSMEEFDEIDNAFGIKMCKNLFLTTANKKNFYLLLMPGDKKFVTKEFSKMVGSSRLSFAKEDMMKEYLNTTSGSASVLGLMNDHNKVVHLVMDSAIYNSEYIGCHPLVNTSSLKIKTSDIIEKFLKETGHEITVVDINKPEL